MLTESIKKIGLRRVGWSRAVSGFMEAESSGVKKSRASVSVMSAFINAFGMVRAHTAFKNINLTTYWNFFSLTHTLSLSQTSISHLSAALYI